MLRKMERPYKPPTRSIGVGDAKVFDTGNNVHVHEKVRGCACKKKVRDVYTKTFPMHVCVAFSVCD